MVSHIEFCLPKKPPTPKNIGEGLKGSQRKLWKEALLVQYDKNKKAHLNKISPLSKNILLSLISPSIREYYCYDAWKFVA